MELIPLKLKLDNFTQITNFWYTKISLFRLNDQKSTNN